MLREACYARKIHHKNISLNILYITHCWNKESLIPYLHLLINVIAIINNLLFDVLCTIFICASFRKERLLEYSLKIQRMLVIIVFFFYQFSPPSISILSTLLYFPLLLLLLFQILCRLSSINFNFYQLILIYRNFVKLSPILFRYIIITSFYPKTYPSKNRKRSFKIKNPPHIQYISWSITILINSTVQRTNFLVLPHPPTNIIVGQH